MGECLKFKGAQKKHILAIVWPDIDLSINPRTEDKHINQTNQ